MLNIRQIAHVGLVGVFVAWVWLGSWHHWHSSVPPNHEQTIVERHNGAEYASPKSAADDRIADYTWWVAAFTLALSVVSAFQLFFLNRADKTVRIAADAASLNAQAAVRAEQAHVFPIIGEESVVKLVQLWARSVRDPGSGNDQIQGLGVSYRLKNYGKTPAIIKVAGHELVHAPRPPENETKISDFLQVDKILGPEECTEPMVCSLHPFSVADAVLVWRAETTVWFHGFVTYDDLFGLERHLEFIWWYNGRLGRLGWYYFKGSEKTTKL
jgi:hypothetical protein